MSQRGQDELLGSIPHTKIFPRQPPNRGTTGHRPKPFVRNSGPLAHKPPHPLTQSHTRHRTQRISASR
jgi:hypothetical protein